jgi:hypothetical protein
MAAVARPMPDVTMCKMPATRAARAIAVIDRSLRARDAITARLGSDKRVGDPTKTFAAAVRYFRQVPNSLRANGQRAWQGSC